MMRFAVMLGALLATGPVLAAELRDCDSWEANARNIWLPPEEGIRRFANGAITLIHLDTGGEPVCCASHLMVLHPAGADEPWQACTLISHGEGAGYAMMALPRAEAGYDPSVGLIVDIPAQLYAPEADFQNPVLIRVTINQATGGVTAQTVPGPE